MKRGIVVSGWVVWSALVAPSAGWARWQNWEAPNLHVIAVNERGVAMLPRVQRRVDSHEKFADDKDGRPVVRADLEWFGGQAPNFSRDGSCKRYDDAYGAYIAAILKHIVDLKEAREIDRIVFYIHGGMNNIHGAVEKAARLHETMLQDRVYPIFICWDSNPLTTYADHLVWVRFGRSRRDSTAWEQGLAIASAPVRLASDLGKGIAEAPFAILQQVYNDASTMNPEWLENEIADRRYESLRSDFEREPLKAIRIERGKNEKEWFEKGFRVTAYIGALPVKSALAGVLVGLGRPMWENMSRRTKTMFRGRDEFCLTAQEADDPTHAPVRPSEWTGAVGHFLNHISTNAVCKDLPVALIGHSMGAIVSNQMLQYLNGTGAIEVADIVYMGAACSMHDFEGSVIPYLQRHQNTRFYGLSLHPEAEYGEDNFILPPRGSLLVWVDSFFNDPQTPMDRTAGHFHNVVICGHVIPEELRDRTSFKCFNVGWDYKMSTGGATSERKTPAQPQKHGEFSNERFRFWTNSYWTVVTPQPQEKTDPATGAPEPLPRSGKSAAVVTKPMGRVMR